MRISDWSSDVCSSDLQRELGGRRRFEPAFAEKLPQRGKEGSEENDIDGVDRLEHRCRHAADIDIAIGVEVKAAARLLEQAPEQRIEPDQEQDRVNPVAGMMLDTELLDREIGRAAGRERGCQYVKISVVAATLKKKKQIIN